MCALHMQVAGRPSSLQSFHFLQEHDALSFIFMHNVGVRFGKVIIAKLITCTCKGYNNIMVLVYHTYTGSFTWYEFLQIDAYI